MTTSRTDLPIVVDRSAAASLAAQISGQLMAAVRSGVLGAGDRLPSTRDLAAVLGVSRTVVTTAYARLFAEGWLEGCHGSGTYVADVAPEPPPLSPPPPPPPSPLHPHLSPVSNHHHLWPLWNNSHPSRPLNHHHLWPLWNNSHPSRPPNHHHLWRLSPPPPPSQPGTSSRCDRESPGRPGSSPRYGGAPGGMPGRGRRRSGRTRMACPSSVPKSPTTCA